MAQSYLYEPQYRKASWFDGSGPTLASWFDHDITEAGGEVDDGVIPFMLLVASFYDDPDLIILLDGGPGTPIVLPPGTTPFPPGFPPTSGVWAQVLPQLFLDPDLFFSPTNARALQRPDQMLKNEVRRIR